MRRRTTVPFDVQCELARIEKPVREYQFASPRRWRFDFAWPNAVGAPLALEVQGGLFIQGRHARGPALLKEHEKLNTAALKGWRVLYCTPKQIADGSALSLVEKAIRG